MRPLWGHVLGIVTVGLCALAELAVALGYAAMRHSRSEDAIYNGLGVAIIGPILVLTRMPLVTVLVLLALVAALALVVAGHVRSSGWWILAGYGLAGLQLLLLVLCNIYVDLAG
jgi:hypothetical protein